MTFARRKYQTTTPEAVRDCLNAGLSIRRAAEVLGVSLHALREACAVFGWRAHGWSGPKANTKSVPITVARVNSVFGHMAPVQTADPGASVEPQAGARRCDRALSAVGNTT